MTKTYLKLAGAVALTALAGCSGGGSSGGGIDIGPVGGGSAPPEQGDNPPVNNFAPNATGQSMTIDPGSFPVPSGNNMSSGTTEAQFTLNDDDTITAKFKRWGNTIEKTLTYYPEAGTASDGAEVFMTIRTEDGKPLLAVIDAVYDPELEGYYAYRSTEGLTENMPQNGTASYTGSIDGFATTDISSMYLDRGGFYADVDFGDSSLKGRISGWKNSVSFDGAINGSEFKSIPGTIALAAGVNSETVDIGPPGYTTTVTRPVAASTSFADQSASSVEGAFYGDAAKAMAGTYAIEGAGPAASARLLGGFVATRGEIQQ
ncbi:transferrin-binding protein-like solute binding protein [Martelella lutilitoris]|uniref:Transferrin-binding protein-like solute binding protein n=1 Tax=Martelella lutilitoris TaxID=2583532 RepID=A0A5C4JX01_9HYPH|nr:transferrin-binding protein-like solute binding protein [Martelella lutilitoris]TNB49760.1 transferrin-binding protein-like solute binding protein [Martelella lutilitoris]